MPSVNIYSKDNKVEPGASLNPYAKPQASVKVTTMPPVQSSLKVVDNPYATNKAPTIGPVRSAPGPTLADIREAIGKFESGGRYDAKGPTVTKGMYQGQQALGKYQVMPGNVASWTKAALGKSLTPEQFLKDSKAQDAVADYQMKIIYDKHGTWQDVASTWLTGKPVKKAGNVKDDNGTNVPKYLAGVGKYLPAPSTALQNTQSSQLTGPVQGSKAVKVDQTVDNTGASISQRSNTISQPDLNSKVTQAPAGQTDLKVTDQPSLSSFFEGKSVQPAATAQTYLPSADPMKQSNGVDNNLTVTGVDKSKPPTLASIFEKPSVGQALKETGQVFTGALKDFFVGENAPANLTKDVAQGLARSVVGAGLTGASILSGLTGDAKSFVLHPENISSFVLGDKPLSDWATESTRSYQERVANGSSPKKAFGRAILAGTIAPLLDLTPFGGEAKGLKQVSKELVALKDTGEVLAKLKSFFKVGDEADAFLKPIARKLATISDEATITKILNRTAEVNKGIREAESVAAKATKAAEDIDKPLGFFEDIGRSLNPKKYLSPKLQEAYTKVTNTVNKAKELANSEAAKLSHIPEKEGWQTILDYQAGRATKYSEEIKDTFASLLKEARNRGLEITREVQNYLPQLYKNTTEEIVGAVSRYMKDKGVADDVIAAYKAGKEIPDKIANSLKLSPTFSKLRVFPDYETAVKYGLTPKYTHPAQLAANYRLEMEKALANQKFVQALKESGEVVKDGGPGLVSIDTPFLNKVFAKPRLAKFINGAFENPAAQTVYSKVVEKVANLSRTMQEIALSAGVPYTKANFFSIGQGIKNVMTAFGSFIKGDIKGGLDDLALAKVFFGPTSKASDLKYFKSKAESIKRAADYGFDITDHAANFANEFKNTLQKFGKDDIFKGFDRAFNAKTFSVAMPMQSIELFERVEKAGLAKGLSAREAGQLAADTAKNFLGKIDDVGRSKTTANTLSSIFFAPKFRESMINALWNTGKSVSTEMFNPAFAKNRSLALGFTATFAGYDYLNYKLNGHHMWENPSGKETDLQIPLPNGDYMYVSFAPSFASMPKNLFIMGKAAATGDLKTFTQKAGSFLSMPIQLSTQLWNNADFFGNEIYEDDDSTGDKAKKIARYSLLQTTHPYVKAFMDQKFPANPDKKKPLLQSIFEASELPLKYAAGGRVAEAEWYDTKDKLTAKAAKEKKEFKKNVIDKVQQLVDEDKPEEAQALLQGLNAQEQKMYKSYITAQKTSEVKKAEPQAYKLYKKIQDLVDQDKQDEATAILANMTETEQKAYLSVMKSLGLVEQN